MPSAWSHLRAEIVTGRRQVQERAPELTALAAANGQQSELTDLAYYLDAPTRIRYTPTLVMLYERQLVAAVLVYDNWFLFGKGKFYTSINLRGRRTVFAPVARRVEAAAAAAQELLGRGALFVNVAIDLGYYDLDDEAEARALVRARAAISLWMPGVPGVAAEWAVHSGIKRYDMQLGPDFDTTVAVFGKRTRRNIRYYPRLCEAELGSRFVPDVQISRADLLAMNEEVSFRNKRAVVEWRYDSFQRFPNLFLHGMQSADGTWLSLISGQRREGEVVIIWQMNRKGYERYSLSTTMRALLIQHEIAIGSTSLTLEGGTPHQMADGCRFRSVYNLAVRRKSMLLRLAEPILLRFAGDKLFTRALVKPWRHWQACWRSSPPQR